MCLIWTPVSDHRQAVWTAGAAALKDLKWPPYLVYRIPEASFDNVQECFVTGV